MNPEKSHFDDKAGDYVYRGTIFDYFDGVGGGFIVRCYDDAPDEPSFLARYDLVGLEKIRKPIASMPYDDLFFISVARHLLSHEGKKELKALTGIQGYEDVELSRVQNA